MILSRILLKIDKMHDRLQDKIQGSWQANSADHDQSAEMYMSRAKRKMAFNNHVNLSREQSPLREGRHSPRNPSPVMEEDNTFCDIPIPIQNIGCQDLLELKCTHCGWLRKRRTLSLFSWPQAYVVLHEGCLYYFKNERARGAAGKFSMYGYNAVYRASEILPKEAPWSFKIVHSHFKEFKTYYFSASSEQEMKIWMSKIKQEMLHANGKSAIYGKKLQHVREEKPDKMLDDPSFYNNIEEDIYDDSSKFVPSLDYQKQCSIKRINEDSEDEEIEIEPNPSIDTRPPLPLPKGQGPFMNSNNPETSPFDTPTPPLLPPPKPPLKPPRSADNKPPVVQTPAHRKVLPDPPEPRSVENRTPLKVPLPRRVMPAEPHGTSDKNMSDTDTTGGRHLTKTQQLVLEVQQQLENKRTVPPSTPPKPTGHKRSDMEDVVHNSEGYSVVQTKPRGSYEQTGGPGNKSPLVGRRGIVPDGSGGGSTGSDDPLSDMEEEWSDIYFNEHDKQKANEILQMIGEDGVYLVRQENSGDGMVLVVFVKDHSRKYRIMVEHGEYFIHREDFRHKCVETLIRHYYHNNLPTMSMMLKMPYKLHPTYKNLNL